MSSRGVRGRCRGRRARRPGERRDARCATGSRRSSSNGGQSTSTLPRANGGEHGDDGAAPPLGPRAKRVGAVDRRRVAGVGCATLADADHGQAVEVGLPTREQAAARQPDPPACACPGRARAAAGGAPRLVRERRARARRRTRRAGARRRRRPRAHARRPRQAPPPGPRQVRDRRRRHAQHACGRRSGSDPRASRTSASASRSCSGPRSGSSSASTATASTSSTEGRRLPSRRQAGPLGVRDAMGRHSRGARRADDRAVRHAGSATRPATRELPIEIERVMPVSVRDRPRRALPGGRRLPHRRRSAPGHSARRHRAQHGDPRRLRHRLEARLGPARLGRHERLLESYERERRPVAEVQHGALLSAPTARSSTPRLGLSADIGGRIAHVWVPRDGRRRLDARPPRRRADAVSRARTGTAPRRAAIAGSPPVHGGGSTRSPPAASA